MKELLISLNACDPAMGFARGKSWREIFETCHRGDWLLWLFSKTKSQSEEDFALLTIAKGHCANTVRHLMKDERSIKAVDASINYSGNRVDLDAAAAAAAAYAAAYADAYAADAASYAAAAAAADAYAADDAYAAAAAADAYAAAYADAYARKKNRKDTADIVRQYIPIEKWNIDINL
jgi:hypothetical protein